METTMIYGRNPVLEALDKMPDKVYIQKGAKDGSMKKFAAAQRNWASTFRSVKSPASMK